MPQQFSDHFNPTQPATAALDLYMPGVGIRGARMRYSRCTVTLDLAPNVFAIDDVARCITMRSRDRIHAMYISAAGATAGSVDVGVYQTAGNGGAVVDRDEFGSAIAVTTTARVECMVEAVAADTLKRGQALWQIIGEAADTGRDYDICLTATVAVTVADAVVVLEIYYTAGD